MNPETPEKRIGVLVAEDDALLLMDAMDLAEEAGFKVYGAHNAEEALGTLEAETDIAILFTDVQMNGRLTGIELAQMVRERWPHIAILITSGVARIDSGDLPPGGLFIAKPYAPNVVIDALREMAQTRGS